MYKYIYKWTNKFIQMHTLHTHTYVFEYIFSLLFLFVSSPECCSQQSITGSSPFLRWPPSLTITDHHHHHQHHRHHHHHHHHHCYQHHQNFPDVCKKFPDSNATMLPEFFWLWVSCLLVGAWWWFEVHKLLLLHDPLSPLLPLENHPSKVVDGGFLGNRPS